jgi:hypothetical protein
VFQAVGSFSSLKYTLSEFEDLAARYPRFPNLLLLVFYIWTENGAGATPRRPVDDALAAQHGQQDRLQHEPQNHQRWQASAYA